MPIRRPKNRKLQTRPPKKAHSIGRKGLSRPEPLGQVGRTSSLAEPIPQPLSFIIGGDIPGIDDLQTWMMVGLSVELCARELASAFHLRGDELFLVNGLPVHREFYELKLGDEVTLLWPSHAPSDHLGVGRAELSDEVCLNPMEETILEALGTQTLRAEAISKKAGYGNESGFRTILASMVRRGLLGKVAHAGYHRA